MQNIFQVRICKNSHFQSWLHNWPVSVSARIHAKKSSASSCWSFKGLHVLILSQTSLVRYSGGLLFVQSVYIVSTWFVPPFVALFVMGFRNWRWLLPCRILLDLEELHMSHEGCITMTEEYNQLGSSASSTMVYSNPLVFKCLSFSSILSCFRGCLNFLVPLYLLGTRGRRREMWVVSVSYKFPLPWHLIPLYLIRECLQLRILHYHQCISNIHYRSLYQSADNHCHLDSLLITPFYLDITLICPFGGLCCSVVIISRQGWTTVVGWSLHYVLH